MKTLVKIIGGNATGKSTRLMAYVDSRTQRYQEISYTWNSITKKYPEGRIRTINAGRLYDDGIFVMGKVAGTGNWVGTDYVLGEMGNKAAAYEFLHWLNDNHEVRTVFAEGYFALGGGLYTLPPMVEEGLFEEVHCYAFLYATAQDYLDRTNARSGKSVTEADWEVKGTIPPGWGSNLAWQRQVDNGKMEELHTSVTVLDPLTTPKDHFVRKSS